MSNNDLAIVILAAGKGTRLKSSLAKVLHRAGGRTLVEQIVCSSKMLKARETVVVVGHQAEQVAAVVEPLAALTVLQQPQNGTGHAMQIARRALGRAKFAFVLPGDAPLVRTDTLKALIAAHHNGNAAATVLSAVLADPSGYGRVVRKSETAVSAIVEESQLTDEQREINEINSAIYCFTLEKLWPALAQVKPNNKHRELYLTDAIGILVSQRQRVGAFKIPSAEEILGINTRQDLAGIDHIMRRRKCESLMAEGVTLVDPPSTFIDDDVQIGADSVIYPSVQIYGNTVIGEDVTIHSFSRISNSKIGARSTVLESCVLDSSNLGEEVTLGPFSRLRPDSVLGDRVRIGNFVEIKKSTLGTDTKSQHLAYLGDATVGKDVNIGAGVITCNYDGVRKYPTIIEDGAFVGTDSQLIAPVRIGKGAYIAAGSSITDDVPPESLAIARGRQTIKEGWAKNRKKK